MITGTDIDASNGVIHTIDNFLFPQATEPTEDEDEDEVEDPSETPGTIVDVASADEDLSILVDAVVYAGLAETLSSAGPFTVFAPTNDVWSKALANPDDITELDADTLKEILLYHTVAGIYTAADITDGLTLTTVQGETIEFSIDGDAVMINGNVMITGTDILASNGVIHTIDNILFP
ncbi:Fasciclin-domain-containing protein, partial [Fragilariopsis cylindrus CCMP1102]